MQTRRRVTVIGGGVSGLATAYFVSHLAGCEVDVTLVERSEELGGKVLTRAVAGHPVDLGPDALLVRVPAMQSLLEDLGLAGDVVGPGANGAFIWSRGRLRPLPASTVFGVPAQLLPLLRSGLLSPLGIARAGLDLVLPRRRIPAGHDVSVGELVRPRFGAQVFDRLVDPLLGGVHAGRADLLSARSAVPEIDALARGSRSIYLGTRGKPAPGQSGPALVTLPGGLGQLIDALRDAVDGCDVRLGTSVERLTRTSDGYLVRLADGSEVEADDVVLATPAHATAELLADLSPGAGAACADIPYADVASLTLVYPREALAATPTGTGFLVPPEEGLLLVGCSWLSTKWPHLSDPSAVLIRAMVGRYGDQRFVAMSDDELVDQVHDELTRTMGLTSTPTETYVQRWLRAMPQYTVGHQARLNRLDQALAQLPGLHVTGAAYRGVGVASCVSQARRTAESVLSRPGPKVASAQLVNADLANRGTG